MDFDGISLRACLRALQQQAAGARLRHIMQPTGLSIALALRAGGVPLWVVCSAEPAAACLFATTEAPGTAVGPSPFCTMLRRHITGLRLAEAAQDGWDRVATLVFAGQDELGSPVSYSLAVEIMGKHSNVICVREDNRILDALKRVGRSKSRVRQVLPGRAYDPPPAQSKLAPDTVTGDQLAEVLSGTAGGSTRRTGPSGLVLAVAGVGVVRAKAIWSAVAAAGAPAAGDAPDWQALAKAVRFAAAQADAGAAADPGRRLEGTAGPGGVPKLSPCAAFAEAFRTYSLSVAESRGTAPGAGTVKEPEGDGEAERQRLAALVAKAARLERGRHAALSEQAEAMEDAGVWLRKGHSLLGSLGAVRERLARTPPVPGQPVSLELPDHEADQPGGTIRVDLAPGEQPARAAQRCLARYAELRRAAEKLAVLLAGSAARLGHLEQLGFQLSQQLSTQELAEVAAEVEKTGIAAAGPRPVRGTGRRNARAGARGVRAAGAGPLSSRPLSVTSPGGFEILVGRNSKQNEALLRRGAPDDVWLHARGVPGAHVVLRRAGRAGEIPAEDIVFAAQLAAGHSPAAQSSSVPVDYTELRFVRRRGKDAFPGSVTYTNEQTIRVRPASPAGPRNPVG